MNMTIHNRPFFEELSNHPMGITSVFQEKPSKYMMLLSFAQELLREESSLSNTDREVIAAYTSKLNGCEYCCGSHTEFALSLGATDQDVYMIETEDIDNHRLASILSYVKKLTLSPSTISNEDRILVHEAGFSDEQLKDAIAVCAAFNLFNRIVEGHGVTPKDSYKDSAEMIKKHGYDRRY
jgi:uncharacterized peroxidase-related enzyme